MATLKEKKRKLKKMRARNIILNMVCVCLAVSGLWWTITYFWRYINYEVTNDAFVDQYVAPLNIRASGYIKDIRFKEHQYVRQGDTLLVLDNREYQIKVKEAEAALLDAHGLQDVLHSGIETSHTNIAVQDANIAEAKAKLWQLEQDYHRFERLLKEESVPEQQYEQTKAAYEAAEARYQALVAQKQAALSQYAETSKKTTGVQAGILRKEADLETGKLLGLEPGEEIYEVEKVYFADGHPAIISVDCFACDLIRIDLTCEFMAGRSIFEVLHQYGGCFIARDKISMETMNREEMEKSVVSGKEMECDSVLVFRGKNYNQENKLVMLDREFYDTRYIQFSLLRVKNV